MKSDNFKHRPMFTVVTVVLLLSASVLGVFMPAAVSAQTPNPGSPSGNGVQPIVIDNSVAQGNVSCTTLSQFDPALEDYSYGFKVEPVAIGNYNVPGQGTVSIDDIYDGTTVGDLPGPLFDWSSTFGINAVLVKGGDDTNWYVYNPPGPASMEDTGLHAPIDPPNNPQQSEKYYGLSHIEFCYGPTTAIELDSFNASSGAEGAIISWTTATEIDNAGFNIYRATSRDGVYERVNFLTIAARGNGAGATYEFVDDTVGDGIYYYQLEDIDLDGTRTLHDPVMVIVGGQQVLLPTMMSMNIVVAAQ